MEFKVIHIVSNLERINFGIWNAAIAGSKFLMEHYGVHSELWVCQEKGNPQVSPGIPVRYLGTGDAAGLACKVALEEKLAGKSVVVSHGCWLRPTQIGRRLKRMSLPWIYAPHGMLEPWSLRQGRLKKEIYYALVEKRLAMAADAIRAVSKQELQNLTRRFNQKIVLIENGVDVSRYEPKDPGPETFLFLGRLHHKKGILPLVRAWKKVMSGSQKKLVIAGPDEGELEKIRPYMTENIEYVGPVYGEKKTELLRKAHYFMLPSFSEGFPTSVVEGMAFGLIPMISNGCNFSEVFTSGLGHNIEPDAGSIESVLQSIREREFDHQLSKANHDYIRNNYSTTCIGEKLYTLYSEILMQHTPLPDGQVLYK